MKPETISIHGGYSPEPTTKAVAVPIYQTTSYAFDNTQHGADLFDLKVQGNIYTRIMNPTTAVLEERITQLEGGHSSNALAIAHYLKQHPKVKWVNYAGLEDHKDYPLVKKYLNGLASGILSFGVQGGKEGGTKFIDALQLFTRLVNIGDAKSLACHPATTTHR